MQTLSLAKGASGTLAVKAFEPADTTDSTEVIWSSDNSSVASVDNAGVVTALSEGTATITATSKINSAIKASCVVTVTNQISGSVDLVGISLTPATVTLEKGNKQSLTVSYSPSNTTDAKSVTWSSDNESVATVNSNGEVTAYGSGKATITAQSTVNPEIKAICTVNVTSSITGINISKTELTLEKGNGTSLTANVLPEDTTQSKAVTWTSSDSNVAQVWGGWVYATGSGTAVITAAATDNLEIKTTCTVTVTDSSENENQNPSGGESENPSGGESENPSGGESENPSGGESENPSGGESENPSGGESENPAEEEHTNGWNEIDGKQYWYENGVRQGYNPDDLSYRGKEVYDPATDAWYWLDNVQGGAKTVSKDVYQESDAGICADNAVTGKGKWVRYDENGHMVKGWSSDGNYYFDLTYGTMVKGYYTIRDIEYFFDVDTGVLKSVTTAGLSGYTGWKKVDGIDIWYEDGQRQGYSKDRTYRGKEVYDPASDAWYWLDNVDNGKKAVSKDVYQESLAGDWGDIDNGDGTRNGKWVRYDADGHMIKGWCAGRDADAKAISSPSEANGADVYYFDPIFGTMAKGVATIDGVQYTFDTATGILTK